MYVQHKINVWVGHNYFRYFALLQLHVLGDDCDICMGFGWETVQGLYTGNAVGVAVEPMSSDTDAFNNHLLCIYARGWWPVGRHRAHSRCVE